jgi:hypothetical protein
VHQTHGSGPDTFASLHVTDSLGNVFSYNGAPFAVSSGSPMVVNFPGASTWTRVSGPGGNNGTDVSGDYVVTGTYLDTTLSELLGHFVVLHDTTDFSVPEFNQSILLLLGMMIPGLLLVRRISLKQPI